MTFIKLPDKIFGNLHFPYFTNVKFDGHFFPLVEKIQKNGGKKSIVSIASFRAEARKVTHEIGVNRKREEE